MKTKQQIKKRLAEITLEQSHFCSNFGYREQALLNQKYILEWVLDE